MRIEGIDLKGFGKWQDASFRFAPGLNLFVAPNEAGKSTLLQGIFAALYGMKRDYVKTARYLPVYEKYRPWNQGEYETIITYHLAGKTYRLHRYLAKEREQARIFLDPEWTELTDIYQEDRRKERDFLEKHLGLTRSLFTDITWITREPLTAGEHLSSSLSDNRETNPAANQVLAVLDRELAGIGKKERAESTLLGKAASLAAQKEEELANAQHAWRAISQLSVQVAAWEEERQELEQLRARLLQKQQRWQQQEQSWQERWQKSHSLPDKGQWEWWERMAVTENERLIHQEAQRKLSSLPDDALGFEVNPQVDGEDDRLPEDYARGVQLRKQWEEAHLKLANTAALAIGSPSRISASRQRNSSPSSKKTLLWASAGVLSLLGIIGFMMERPASGVIALGLAAAAAGWGWIASRQTESGREMPPVEESAAKAEWTRLQGEVSRLDAEIRQLLEAWGVQDWDAFVEMRELRHDRLRAREAQLLYARQARQNQVDQIVDEWQMSLHHYLEREKAHRESERQSWQSELARADERLQDLREEIARASGEMGAHETVSVAKAVSEYEEAQSGLKRLQQKREALQLARDSLQEAISEWNRDASPAVNEEASQAMELITAGAYRDVRLDPRDGFAIRVMEPAKHLVLEQEQCSTGTQDQLYFAQRLALHQHVSRETEPLPLFFDDHFVHYDEYRLQRALGHVAKLSEEHQIFLFTCQERELAVLEPLFEDSTRLRVHRLQ